MSPLRCLITGADFLDTDHDRWIHGDLHQLLDTLIFNADGCKWNNCAEKPLPEGSMTLRADHFYERNSQIVFPLSLAMFNDYANAYLTEMLNKLDGEAPPMIMVVSLDEIFGDKPR